VFLKETKVDMGDNISINPMDTTQFTYDDLKDLIEDTDIDIDDL
jgi:hypothetical protein